MIIFILLIVMIMLRTDDYVYYEVNAKDEVNGSTDNGQSDTRDKKLNSIEILIVLGSRCEAEEANESVEIVIIFISVLITKI